ncbi:MAG: type II toxin-antitoxin system Phd/YefM family antitoxin [Proteobacteria bacterium]|nr:type II toxin-antitoxin system Phd/YefM family antitoxin [Pseudomonadota bacterium]MBU1709252.1 type II toxin-antitoxin system Phd/YefM family antitoxin [Pseudomonadota bacterium]
MPLTASALRGNIYKLLDQVLESGQPLTIERKGKLLQIVSTGKISKLKKLVKHSCLKGDPESIVHLDWSEEWRNDLP